MTRLILSSDDETAQLQTDPRVTTGSTPHGRRPTIVIASGDGERAQQLATLLREENYAIVLAPDRPIALRTIVWELPDLVILDTQLAGDDRIALCASLKRDIRTCQIPIILTADSCDADEHLRCIEAGADDYLCRSEYRLLSARARALLQARSWIADVVPLDQVILALEQAVAAKDDVTGGHMRRLACYAALIGQRLGLSDQMIEDLCAGARLHDVGKIGIADAILCKPGALSAEEYSQVRQHPQIGTQILEPLGLSEAIVAIVRHHHERWDGRGYPDGLGGAAIPLGARVVAVADAFDAMTAERPYGQPMTVEAAVERLRDGAGAQWDPTVVEALIECLAEIVPPRERAVSAPAEDVPERRLRTWLETSGEAIAQVRAPRQTCTFARCA